MNSVITTSDGKDEIHEAFETLDNHPNHERIISDENANIGSSDNSQSVLPISPSTSSIEQDSLLIGNDHPLIELAPTCNTEGSNVFVPLLDVRAISTGHHMVTRLKDGIIKPNPNYSLQVSQHEIPQ